MADSLRRSCKAKRVTFGGCEVVHVEHCIAIPWKACELADMPHTEEEAAKEDEESEEASTGARHSSERVEARAMRRCTTPRAGDGLSYEGPLLHAQSLLWRRRQMAGSHEHGEGVLGTAPAPQQFQSTDSLASEAR
mmetsp:Transcript_73475/g.227845  ORF Transcript_73475/g.227845 Transcript_73475/m.227845 type:complete len:136 (+) Transcript_73475:67-474(+)